jgi:hypothetical protein
MMSPIQKLHAKIRMIPTATMIPPSVIPRLVRSDVPV